MPTNTTTNGDDMSDVEQGDTVKLGVRHNGVPNRTVLVEVRSVRRFDGGSEWTCAAVGGGERVKVYGDFWPPIVEQFDGDCPDDGRLMSIKIK